jgi:hypothetical protein
MCKKFIKKSKEISSIQSKSGTLIIPWSWYQVLIDLYRENDYWYPEFEKPLLNRKNCMVM